MNREISFRVWDTSERLMYYFDFYDIEKPNGSPLGGQILRMCGDGIERYFPIHRQPVMQFTGLKDSVGKDIYESDKVLILYTDWVSQHLASEEMKKLTLEDYKKAKSEKGVVVWKGDAWKIEFEGRFGKEYGSIFPGTHGQIEVVGNIHENAANL